VGVLLPLSLVAIQVVADHGPGVAITHILIDVFVADVWFAVALLLGLFVLFVVAYESGTMNVMNARIVVLPLVWQFIALIVGGVRLLIGVAGLAGRG
jgi:hypothetical protein